MVARRFLVRHDDVQLPVDYDTDHGLEVLKFQIFSLTSVPPDDQKILAEEEGLLVGESSNLGALSEKLRLVSLEEAELMSLREVPVEEAGATSVREVPIEEETEAIWESMEMSDEELARMLQAEEEALLLQQYNASKNGAEFRSRIEPYVRQVLTYEDPARQEAARKTVPIDELEEKALVSLAKEGNFTPTKNEEDYAFLLQLLFWFKQSFRWVNSPPCNNCSLETSNIGMGSPLPSEIEFGGLRVELYRCNHCSSITRFPRYNDPIKLIETRRGRCGEWANCFTHYCRAFGYEARLILDFTDHVWTECFSHLHGRWVHLDPCEGRYDNPLLYEKGWGKNLNYVIAIAKDGVYDVTKRYTRKWHEVLSRRRITTEDAVSSVVSSITTECRSKYSKEMLSMLELRDVREREELERASYLQVDPSVSLPGRQSGSVEWRRARSELGLSETQSLSSCCPIRVCVDAHVSNIYGAFALLLSGFHDNKISENKPSEVLEMLKNILLDLKKHPFRRRRSLLDSTWHQLSEEMMHTIERLFVAISLKKEMDDEGILCVTVSGNPIQSSLALPVALDAVDEILSIYKSNDFTMGYAFFPTSNRLYSGSVLASGEEFPAGIATSAFDGLCQSKWEEPNGAKGCWLIYRVPDGQMYGLESYDLMSANDAPERDPRDWILEGSADGGSSWIVIDKQSSQIFEKRFLRKTFKVVTVFMANAFRFRFLAVRDANSNSRFQIGSIDLYAKPN